MPQEKTGCYNYNVEPFRSSLPAATGDVPCGAYIFWCRDIPFNFIHQIKVSYKMDELTGSFILNQSSPAMLVSGRTGKSDTAAMTYDLEFQTNAGNYIQTGLTATTLNFVYNPFTPRTVQFLPVGLDGSNPYTSEIQINYHFNERGKDWEMAGIIKNITLFPDSPVCTLEYPVVDQNRSVLVYNGTIINADGTSKIIPSSKSNQCIIPVGFYVDWVSVQVDSMEVNWSRYKIVRVYLYTSKADGSTPNESESACTILTFKPATGSLYWGYLLKSSGIESYYWKASYYVDEFTDPITTNIKEEQFSAFLMLPREPSVNKSEERH